MNKYPDSELYKEVFGDLPILSLLEIFTTQAEVKSAQKEKFEKNLIRNPEIATEISFDLINYEKLLKSKYEIVNGINESYIGLYKNALHKLELQLEIARASQANDWKLFKTANINLYGDYSIDLWNYSLFRLEEDIQKAEMSGEFNEEAAYLKKQINIRYDVESASSIKRIVDTPLKSETVKDIKSITQKGVKIPNKSEFTSKEMLVIFKRAVKVYGLNDSWKVTIHPDFEGFTVYPGIKAIYVPNNRVYTKERVLRLITHEIGVHAQRKDFNNNNATLKILRRDAYNNTTEEGLATLVEVSLRLSNTEQYISYLLVGLALGLDGTKRDFRDIYEILIRINIIRNGKANSNDVWTSCIKTFLGTDYSTKGVCYFRRKSYFQDFINVKRYLLKYPKAVPTIFKYKYDFLNEEIASLFKPYL